MLTLKTIFAIILLPLILYFFSFFSLFNDLSFYNKLFVENDVNTTIGMGMSTQLLKYFNSNSAEKPSIIHLNDEENTHMHEVKQIINKVKIVFIASIILFLILMISSEEKNKVFFYGGILTILLPIILYLIPFDYLFVLFHKLSFIGKWQFPIESIMIRTFPQGFFYDFSFWIFLRGIVFGGVVVGLSKIDLLKKKFIKPQKMD